MSFHLCSAYILQKNMMHKIPGAQPFITEFAEEGCKNITEGVSRTKPLLQKCMNWGEIEHPSLSLTITYIYANHYTVGFIVY